MRKFRLVAVMLLIGLALVAVQGAAAKDKGSTGRLLTGKVLDRHDNPVPDAIVYLLNTRTRALKSYIVAADGA
jgi:hypothetical protein